LWNLLDIVSILADDEQVEPGLLFWLVEELLDSQTISGCRKIFDFLESRRERITAKHFASKNLVILRSCNELLRRLSRAEDTAFCGRVFIFMFQSFPLGDRSSVNLRGEFHTENVTTFDVLPPKEPELETMDMDRGADLNLNSTPSKEGIHSTSKKASDHITNYAKGVSFSKSEKPLDADELYPMFWSLQQSFSQPKNLFDANKFAEFKIGLEATMDMFKSVQTESPGRSSKVADDTKRGTKRKRGQSEDDLANAFNPKYLTSRDLFELEVS
jgi:THO complex subunit 1